MIVAARRASLSSDNSCSKWQIPHIRAKQDTLHDYQAFYSRHNAFIEMKMTLHLMTNTIYKEEKGTLCGFGNILEDTITLAVFDIPIVLTESQVLY